MRAKLEIMSLTPHLNSEGTRYAETIALRAVAADAYEPDGLDPNNTYALFSPTAVLNMRLENASMLNQYEVGTQFIVDFTEI
jgi:hypothetical protein